MAIGDRLYKKEAGKRLRFLFAQLRSGIRGGAVVYRRAVDIDPEQAVTQLKRGIDLPHQMRDRLNSAVSKYGQQAIIDALTSEGDVTIAELRDELTTLEAYTQGLVDLRNGGASWEDICTDIETAIPEIDSERWAFEIPTRTSIWDR